MANITINDATLAELTAGQVAADDVIPIWDVSAAATKRATRNALLSGGLDLGGNTLQVTASGVAALVTVGNWTPALAASSGSGITYGTQIGRYVKLDRLVVAQFKLVLTSKGTLAGGLTITGLPFTVLNVAGFDPASALLIDTVSFAAGPMVFGAPIVNDSRAYLVKANSATANALLQASEIGNTTTVSGTLIYQTS